MSRAKQALRDLFRAPCWTHEGVDGDLPSRRPWLSRFTWKHNLYPWFGGDEWCRWTLVVPLIVTSLVVPLWSCRNPDCEACEIDCTLARAGSQTSTGVDETPDASRSHLSAQEALCSRCGGPRKFDAECPSCSPRSSKAATG